MSWDKKGLDAATPLTILHSIFESLYYAPAYTIRSPEVSSNPAIWTEGIRSRHYATITPSVPSESGSSLTDVSSRARRLPKKEGTIADVFSFSNEEPPLPPRFADLKKEIFSDAIIHSWKEVVNELVLATEEIATLGGKVCSDCGG